MDPRDLSPAGLHRRAWDLIPWVVNGSADAAERQRVEAHLATCTDCSDELARQSQLQAAIASSAVPPHDPGAALLRLWSRIDRLEGDAADGPAEPAPAMRTAGNRWTPWLAAAVVVQAIGLAALAGAVWERPRAADYATLSRTVEPPMAASIRLVPAPSLQIGELRSLLAQAGVQIVGSNGDGSILTLAAASGSTVADSLARLRAAPGVLLAEPVGVDTSVRP